MKRRKFDLCLPIVVLLVLWPICQASAVEPSPAGGGYLEVFRPGGYAFVEDHDDFDANLAEEFTIELWIYVKRPPKFGETWVILHKEKSYLLELSGHVIDLDGKMLHLGKDSIFVLNYDFTGGRGGRVRTQEQMPLNQWHHLALVAGKKGYQFYINGQELGGGGFLPVLPLANENFPLYIGGTALSPFEFGDIKWAPFTDGLIDEVRISNIARYPVEQFEVDIPRHRLEPDAHTMALWHFGGSRADWLKDASGNGHTLKALDLAYGVESLGKLPTLWGRIKKAVK